MARKQEIEVSTRLGRRRIDLDKVIHFPRGLAGFEGLHQFTLLQIRPDAPLLILQSLDNPALGLLVADPFSFIKDYRIKIGDAEQKLLGLKNVQQVAVLVTVSIPSGCPEETSLNLTGPICINHEARLGLQVPQAEEGIPSQVRLCDLRDKSLYPEGAGPTAPTAPSAASAPDAEDASAAGDGPDAAKDAANDAAKDAQAPGKTKSKKRRHPA